MSPCTALATFTLGFSGPAADVYAAVKVQEGLTSLLMALEQLQCLEVWDAPMFTVRTVGQVRGRLPQLQQVRLLRCGRLLLRTAADREREEEMVGIVQQMLRGLVRMDVTW
jgi:hypothetical protein